MINFFCGWLAFFYMFANIALVSSVHAAGYIEPECWLEKRLGKHPTKYQPMTVMVRVCK